MGCLSKRAIILFTIWTIIGNGCAAWRQLDSASIHETDPAYARVTLRDGSRFKVMYAYAEGDTLFGLRRRWGKNEMKPVAIPVHEIAKLEEAHFSLGKTTLLVVGCGAAFMTALASVEWPSYEFD